MFIQKYILDNLSINKFEQRKTRLVKYQRMIQCVLPPFYIKHISKSYTLISIPIFDAEHNLDFVAIYVSGGSKGWGKRDAHALGGVHLLSISCSFWKNLAKLYVGAPLENRRSNLGEILHPPLHVQSPTNTLRTMKETIDFRVNPEPPKQVDVYLKMKHSLSLGKMFSKTENKIPTASLLIVWVT